MNSRPIHIAACFFGLLALVAGLGVIALAALWLKIRIDARARKFASQLDATLQLMVSSLRTGYGVAQAVDAVAHEAPSPTGEEFRRDHEGRQDLQEHPQRGLITD